MASQSLYRKWRSQTFADVIGQEAVVRTLLNAVRDGRLAHAYLFCGPRGTGKTSSARLLAKAVNCANPTNGEPCNECISCREIAAGTSPDVIEIDAASNNSVDDIRELRGNVNLIGSGGRYKVYIIDECHMLSPQAWNALLKTLEEPPPHIIFVFATTEATKVLATVVSRCQRFDFRRIGMRDIVGHLRHVAEAEGLDLEPAAADLLARAAQGGMRDALSLLDQAMAFAGPHIDLDRARAMLGLADPGALRRLVACVADDQPGEGLQIINDLVESGADLRQLTAQLAEEFRALVLARAGADVARLMDRTDDEAREITGLAKRFSLEELTACAHIFTRGESPARGLPMPQLALEVTFLECLGIKRGGGAISPVAADSPAPHQRETSSQRVVSPPPVDRPSSDAPVAPPRPTLAASAQSRPSPVAPTSRGGDPITVEELDLDALDASAGAPTVTRAAQPPALSLPPDDEPAHEGLPTYDDDRDYLTDEGGAYEASPDALLRRIQNDWPLIKRVCKQKSSSVSALLFNARPVAIEPGELLTLVIQADHSFHHEKLREAKSKQAVEWALEQVLERPVRIRIALGGSQGGGASGGGRGPTNGGNRPGGNGSAPVNGSGAQNAKSGNSGNSSLRESGGTSGASQAAGYAESAMPRARVVGAVAVESPAPVRPVVPDAQPSNISQFRPSANRPSPRPVPSLEAEVSADPVVQALTRAGVVHVADVRPLDEDEDG